MHDVAFRLTTGELALAVPTGVILGALVGLIGQWLTSKINIAGQKQQLLWQARAELYARVIPSVERVGSISSSILRTDLGPDMEHISTSMVSNLVSKLKDHVEILQAERAMVEAIGSKASARHYRRAVNQAFFAETSITSLGKTIMDEETKEALENASNSADKALAAMQADLQA